MTAKRTTLSPKQQMVLDLLADVAEKKVFVNFLSGGPIVSGCAADADEDIYPQLIKRHGGNKKAWGGVITRLAEKGIVKIDREYADGFGVPPINWLIVMDDGADLISEIVKSRHADEAPAVEEKVDTRPDFKRTAAPSGTVAKDLTATQRDFMETMAACLTHNKATDVEKLTTADVYDSLVQAHPETTRRSWSSVGASMARKSKAFRTSDDSKHYILSNEAYVLAFAS